MIVEQPEGNKLTGFYRGIVLKHLSNGFCKVWIPGVYPDEWNSYESADMLPSAEQAAPLGFGSCSGLGLFSYPNIGATVWCFFQNGDQNLPVYFAATLGGQEASANWDKARAMAGSHPDDAYVHKLHVKNSDIEVYETGQIKLHTENGGNSCDLLLDADGNASLVTTTTIRLKTKSVIIDAETQIDVKSPQVGVKAGTAFNVQAPAINLDSSAGHTKIRSSTGTTLF